MVKHEAACRRWRACVAMNNLVAPRQSTSCTSYHKRGDYSHGHWQNLTSFISAMQSSDLVLKIETLHQLSLFLLYVAPNSESSFNCPDAQTVCIPFQNKDILLALKDVQALYRLLFFELANHTAWLFEQESSTKESESTLSFNLHGHQCDHVHLLFIVKVLQCCIHILPLLEFNTGLSLVAAEALMSLLRRLTCPTNPFWCSTNAFDEMMDNYRKQTYKSNNLQANCCFEKADEHSNSLVLFISSVEASIKGLQEQLLGQNNRDSGYSHFFDGHTMACPLHSTLTPTRTDRAQIACALLEVFLEELLLRPCLADLLVASDVLDSSRNFSPCGKLAIEAAAMHFIYSLFDVDCSEMVHDKLTSNHLSYYRSRMSLPAAVMLLDLSIVDAPDLFLLHIVDMLRKAFNDASCLTLELPGGMVLGLAASALESAATLYSRFWKPGSLPSQHNLLQHGEILNCLSDKFCAMCDGNKKKVASILELLFNNDNFSNIMQQEHRSRHPSSFFSCTADATFCRNETLQCSFCAIQSACYDSVYNGQEPDQILRTNNDCFASSGCTFHGTNTALLVSVLHLMSTALLCLISEADKHYSKLTLRPWHKMDGEKRVGQTFLNTDVYISRAKEVFKFCASVDRTKVLEELQLDKQVEEVVLKADELTANAFTFFAQRLHWSLKQGAPKALCEAYLDILKTLLTFFVLFERGQKLADSASGLLCKAPLMTTMEEEQNIAGRCGDESVHDRNCVSGTMPISHDAPMTTGEEDQNTLRPYDVVNVHNKNFASTTMSLTKIYQRKRTKAILAKGNSFNMSRMSETKIAVESEHMDDPLHAQKPQEKGSCRKHYCSVKDGSTFIKEVIASEGKVGGDCFTDLNDFIVCKKDRDYSKWMKSLYKKRKKKLRKMFWPRLKARRALLALLTRGQNDFPDFQMCNSI